MSTRDCPVGLLRDLPDGAAREFRVGDGDWPLRGFVVHWQGQVYAYENTCPHAGHPLNLDPDRFFGPDGATLICRSHGAMFEPTSGLCLAGPCAGASLRAWPCAVEAGEIRVRVPVSRET